EEGFHGCLEFRTDIFDALTLRRWLGHFKTLLASSMDHPDRALAELAILSPSEEAALLALSQGAQIPAESVRQFQFLFERTARLDPQLPALRWLDSTLSYRELNAQANRLAHALRAWGVGPESLVALCFERG